MKLSLPKMQQRICKMGPLVKWDKHLKVPWIFPLLNLFLFFFYQFRNRYTTAVAEEETFAGRICGFIEILGGLARDSEFKASWKCNFTSYSKIQAVSKLQLSLAVILN